MTTAKLPVMHYRAGPRLFGDETATGRPSLQHNALHMAKYAGELAVIAEDADHRDPVKRRRAIQRAKEWLAGERQTNFKDHYEAILYDLKELAESEPA